MAAAALSPHPGLYIHVPFCAKKCVYCDFPSFEGCMGLRAPYVDKLIAELDARAEGYGHPAIHTVFIGGGTPSLLQPEQMTGILDALYRNFPLAGDAEISCEANPGALTPRFLAALRNGGVNRLSLGAQSADAEQLKLLNRQHSWAQVEQAVRLARRAGFDNLNIDLMLGIPGQSVPMWADTLDRALALSPEHLSCYGLIVEDGTPMKRRIDAGELILPEPEEERAMYEHTLNRLKAAGFEQYEISNFAKPGKACRHNLNCWRREDYLGFGSAAHGLEYGGTRRANPASIQGFIAGEPPLIESIGLTERMFESLMLGLRMTRGIDLRAFEDTHGQSFESVYGKAATQSLMKGRVQYTEDGFFRLTREGMDLMNAVLLDFM